MATTQKSINRLLENERNLSFNIKKFDPIHRGIFGPATFCITAVIYLQQRRLTCCYLLVINQIAIKFQTKHSQLSFISLKSIRYHCVTMYTCSNVERIMISRIIIMFFTQKYIFCEHKLLRKCVCGLGSNMTPQTYAIF